MEYYGYGGMTTEDEISVADARGYRRGAADQPRETRRETPRPAMRETSCGSWRDAGFTPYDDFRDDSPVMLRAEPRRRFSLNDAIGHVKNAELRSYSDVILMVFLVIVYFVGIISSIYGINALFTRGLGPVRTGGISVY